MSTTTTDADFTLTQLYEEGIQELADQEVPPGTTYEVAPGIVGTFGWLTLEKRQKATDIRSELAAVFDENASEDAWENTQRLMDGELLYEITENGKQAGEQWAESKEEALESFCDTEAAEQRDPGALAATPKGDVETALKEDSEEEIRSAAAVNCELTAYLLEFDEKVQPSDIVPEMAAVVSRHFTTFGAPRNGQATS